MPVTLKHDWFPQPVPENVRMGKQSWLYSSFAFRHYRSVKPWGVTVGHDTGLYNGTFFDIGPEGEVKIGNYCTLVGAIIASNGQVEIGDYCFLAHEVVLADSFASLPGCDKNSKKNIIISKNVWIGAQAVILGGAHIGEGAVIGAAAVVNFEVPPFAVVAGNPARIINKLTKT